VAPWLAGLSAVATNNSGYMFIGVIGFTYAAGLASVWLMVGWILGDLTASLFIHRQLRVATGAHGALSYPSVLAAWGGFGRGIWRRVAALVMLAFLGAYTAAQISAGGKALLGVLGWPPESGALLVAAMVLAYSLAGGIRASIWTDAAQALVMLAAMAILLAAAVDGRNGQALAEMGRIPGFLDLLPDDLLLPGAAGIGLFILGWMFAGFSVAGQPHVMIRFMALEKPEAIGPARLWYYGYFTVFYALTTGVGLLSRLYLPELASLDPELALPTMATALLPPALVGLILAGIFAATMSTADSLILSCSAALTRDLPGTAVDNAWARKGATAAVTALALAIALGDGHSVFSLVILAWSALASAFAPLLTLLALGRRPSERLAIGLMALGVAIAAGWRAMGWQDGIYEGMPGILVPLAVGWLLTRASPQHAGGTVEAAPAETVLAAGEQG
jgi:SSS family solute:Na+ symporter/sodium/proline symporter